MTELNLPHMPTSAMYIDGIMSIEWQEFFRSLFERAGGTDGLNLDETSILSVSQTEINYGKEIKELQEMLLSYLSDKPRENVYKMKSEYIDFFLNYDPRHQEGRLHHDLNDESLEYGLAGGNVKLQIGFEMLLPRRVKNTSGVDIKNGEPVYITGGSGNNAYIALADASDHTKSRCTGLATEDIDNNAFGWVTNYGIVRGDTAQPIDTSGFSAVGAPVLLDATPGGLTEILLDPPNSLELIGLVWRKHATEGEIFVYRQTTPRLAYLPDVDARGNQADGEMLVWNSSQAYYESRGIVCNDNQVICHNNEVVFI